MTIIYYTSNREPIETTIMDRIKEVSYGLPIISVSHKPINFGKNICIGDQYPCDHNIYRQLLIGLHEAKSEYVFTAESDCLYPEDYFNFKPDGNKNVYRYADVRIMHVDGYEFYRKRWTEGGQLVHRQWLINQLETAFEDRPEWAVRGMAKFQANRNGVFTNEIKNFEYFGIQGIISLKTGYGLRKKCGVERNSASTKLDYWGTFDEVKQKFLKVFDK